MTLRRILMLAAFALIAPLASRAQSCPDGYTFSTLPGGGFSCIPTAAAPEIGASSSIGGVAVLMGGIVMLRGRKRTVRPAADVAA